MNAEKQYVNFDHVTYVDDKLSGECLNDRLWFIAKQLPNDDYTFNQARKLALYWYNKKQLKCIYSAPVERKIKEVETQLYL